ncbi:hypothetical protein EDB19DRAFT_252415 [Suillus lakei]|nr:hypothetical protein EDB19DRAFT_252415 [Suillus lakei]
MHQALFVSDVLLDIFAHVNNLSSTASSTGQRPSSWTSLASLAATCKAFHEPAMDLLWAKVDSLVPLLGCVTRLHPLIYRTSYDYAPWTAGVEPLSADETPQFLRHSARIRLLNIPTNQCVQLLSVIPVEACVFPRLQSLNISSSKYLGIFLSHTLRHCSVYPVHLPRSIGIPHTTGWDLSIKTFDRSTADQLSLLSDRVRSCKQLVTLSCPPLDWAAWKHLSNLPTLVKVRLREVRGHVTPPWPLERIINFSPFLNLTALAFTVDSAAYTSTIMQHSQFPSLKEFEITIEVLSSIEAERLLRALSHYQQTLEQLTVILGEFDDPKHNSSIAISQFLCFTQLRSLRLDSCIYLDNNLLLEAISAWPHIHTLLIATNRFRPPITFRGLFTALHQCPRLKSLRVLVDTTNIDVDPDAEPIPHTSLQTLELDSAEPQLANAEAIARLILTWLPCVYEVEEFSDDWGPWDEVNMHLTSLRAATLHATQAASNT